MITKRVIYTRPDGGVSVLQPASSGVEERMARGMTEAQAIDDIVAKDVPPDAIFSTMIEMSQLPSREFRNAWVQVGAVISVDMPKARDIHAERIAVAQAGEISRLKIAERQERLKGNTAQANQHATDITALEALDLGALATQIAAVATPTALKAIWPAKVPRP